MNEIDLLQYNSEENTEQKITEKPKRKKTLLQMESIKKAQEIHKQNADIRRAKRAIELEKYNKKKLELEEEYVRNLEQKILKKALAIKKRSIIEDSIIEKIIGLDDIPIEKINVLLKQLQFKKIKIINQKNNNNNHNNKNLNLYSILHIIYSIYFICNIYMDTTRIYNYKYRYK